MTSTWACEDARVVDHTDVGSQNEPMAVNESTPQKYSPTTMSTTQQQYDFDLTENDSESVDASLKPQETHDLSEGPEQSVAGNGRDEPTIIATRGDEEQCPYCNGWYNLLSGHWSHPRSQCEWPPISDYKMELSKGMMLGDGSWNESRNRVVIAMTNLSFLQWLSSELDWLCGKLSMHKTAVGQAEGIGERLGNGGSKAENCLDYYRMRTRTHPSLQKFSEWYSTGEIVFPEDLSTTPTTLKMWYVSDGCLCWKESCKYASVQFKSINESGRPQAILGALEEYGFTVWHSEGQFKISSTQTPQFFDLIGEAPPGFEYKWAYEDRERYDRLKEQCREEHCTQTLE